MIGSKRSGQGLESEIQIGRGSVERLDLVLIWEELEACCGACLHSISRGQRLERGKFANRGQMEKLEKVKILPFWYIGTELGMS